MSRLVALVVLASSFVLPVGAGDAPLPDVDDWKVVATDHFTVYSDADDKRTTQVLRDLETLRAVLSKVTSGLTTRTAKPVHVYVFKKAASFRRYVGDVAKSTKEIAGFHVTGPDRNVLAMTLGVPSNPAEIVYHEYLHEVMAATIPKIPLWLNEGIAEYYTTFSCDDGVAEIGRPIKDHVMTLRGTKMMPVRELFAVDGTSDAYNEKERAGIFYAQSWALVHWLMRGNAERREELAAYLNRLAEGASPEQNWTPLELSVEEIERELGGYIRQASFGFVKFTMGELDLPAIPAPKAMPAHEALTSLGWLSLLTHDGDRADGERHFRAALERFPRYAPAYSGLGWILSTRGRSDEAAAMFDEALKADPTDAKSAFLAGLTAFEREVERLGDGLQELAPPTPGMARARELLGRALARDPDNAPALAAYGASFVATDGDPARGITALERAADLMPSEPSIAINLALLYIRAHERDKAEAWIEHRVALLAEPADLEVVRDALLQLDVEDALGLFRSGREAEALEKLRSARARCSDPQFAASIDAMIASAENAMRHNRIARLYNEAIEELRAGRVDEGKRRLAELAAECTEGEVCDQVRRTLEQFEAPPPRQER